MKTTKMCLGGYLLAEFREADTKLRESEGYYYRHSNEVRFIRMCGYNEDPKQRLLETLPEECRPFVTWSLPY